MFAEMWFHVGISLVVRFSSIFLRGLVVDAHSSPPMPFLFTPFFPHLCYPSLHLHLNLFPFSECSNLSHDTGKIRMGSSLKISSDMVLLPLAWGHRTKMRVVAVVGDLGIGSSVTFGETSWSAGCSVGPQGCLGCIGGEGPRERALNQCHLLKVTSYF